MKRLLLCILWICLGAAPAWAHRLDEYLQATMISVEPGAIQLTLRMVPGVSVAERIVAQIDSNGDGLLSQAEERAYALQVLRDLSLKEDGRPLPLRLDAMSFPSAQQMRQGAGEIVLQVASEPLKDGRRHELAFENHHMQDVSIYLVNMLVPKDANLRMESQFRNRNQSLYRSVFERADGSAATTQPFPLSGLGASMRMGMRHIAEGTDHLLFLLTLLLPAPLAASAHRWAGPTSARESLTKILRVVTAFTLGHSLTLAAAGFGLVKVPSRPIEVLIAVSIFVSAIHALRPLFPGREALISASFGLIHGLAFASALSELGVTGWYRLISVFGFNVGIETMQLMIVAAALPFLLLLSRTALYQPVRIMGAIFALAASSAWMIERVSGDSNETAQDVERLVRHGALLLGTMLSISIVVYAVREGRSASKELQT